MSDQVLMDLVERMRSRFYGKYRGTVTVVGTGSDLGRIKATIPSVLGDVESGWCMPCVPYAGDKVGMAFLPEAGAGVWIEFEGGDVSFPIWVGCYWHQGQTPDKAAPDVKVIRTPGEHLIVLDDKNHVITISDRCGNSITLEQKGITITRPSGKILVSTDGVNVNDNGMVVT